MFRPGLPAITVDPELVLVIFLPPLFDGAWSIAVGRLRRHIDRYRVACRRRRPRRQFGRWRNHPVHDQRQRQVVAAPARAPAATLALQLHQADPLGSAKHCGDMAMGQRTAEGQRLVRPRQRHAAAQQRAQVLDQRLRPICEVGDRALLDLAAGAIAFALQKGGMRFAIRDGLDVNHGSFGSRCGTSCWRVFCRSLTRSPALHRYQVSILLIRSTSFQVWKLAVPPTNSSRNKMRTRLSHRPTAVEESGQKNKRNTRQNQILICWVGAPGRDRTSTPVRATDFESAASTNSATGALPWTGPNGSGLYAEPLRRQLSIRGRQHLRS